MKLPTAFIQTQLDIGGERGRKWVEALPALIAEFEQRWDISVGESFNLSYNYVAAATQEDGTPLVFKAAAPYLDADVEGDALQLYNSKGAIKLIQRNFEKGVLLLERCMPGTELATLVPERDDDATAIAADVMTQLWRPLPDTHPFPTLANWTQVLERIDTLCDGAPPPMDMRVVDAAQNLRIELLASTTENVLLHGDLHHHNILLTKILPKVHLRFRSGLREIWKAIDPKGIAGDRAYEPSSFLYNPTSDWLATLNGPQTVRRRIDILSERAGLDRQRVIGWAVVQGILSSAWGYEDGGTGWPRSELVAAWALEMR